MKKPQGHGSISCSIPKSDSRISLKHRKEKGEGILSPQSDKGAVCLVQRAADYRGLRVPSIHAKQVSGKGFHVTELERFLACDGGGEKLFLI